MPALDVLLPCCSALLDEAARDLDAASESPRLDAEVLLAFALDVSRGWLYAHDETQPTSEQFAVFLDLVRRRKGGEPIAYITGRREFWSLELVVNRHTLIPRPETELLVELALERLPTTAAASVADLGTGSGAIALALASERRAARIIGTDISADALAVARYNARRLGLDNLEWRHGTWLEPVAGERFDVIVSNPPYVAEHDPRLTASEIAYEPRSALAAGPKGLHSLRQIITHAPPALAANGWLLLEHGPEQGTAVAELLCAAGFDALFVARDLAGHDRVSGGCRPGGKA